MIQLPNNDVNRLRIAQNMAHLLTPEEVETMKKIAYEEELITTQLKPATLEEKANIFRPRIIEAAEKETTITYSELTDRFSDLMRFDIGEVLGIMGLVEDRYEQPLLPAVIVQAETGWPGHNYFGLVKRTDQVKEDVPPESAEGDRREMWTKHRDEVWNYNWG